MDLRSVGDSGLRVSAVGLGTVGFGDRIDFEAARAVVDAALDAGVTVIDTSDSYARGRSEEMLGLLLKGRRDDVVIATKFGADVGNRNGDDFDARSSRRYILTAVEASLRRLRTDYIDLYQLHLSDGVTPVEETLAALGDLIAAGKVRYAGASNLAAWQVNEADWVARDRRLSRFVSLQTRYSLLQRDAEAERLPVCRTRGIGLLASMPLATGLLTGRWHHGEALAAGSRMWQARSLGLATEPTADVVDLLAKFADERGVTLVDLAIGWLLAQPGVTAAITGASTPEQIQANAAAGAVRLTAADLAEIERITAIDDAMRAPPSPRRTAGYDDARHLIASLLLDGESVDDVVGVLVAEGVDPTQASELCQQVVSDPVLEAGMVRSERLHKLDAVLTMRQTMRELTDYGSAIERRDNVSTDEFLEIYYAGNLPLVLTDVCSEWPARTTWTPDYLLTKIGDSEVEVTSARDADPRYEVNADHHKTVMSFADYVRRIESEPGNDLYIVANNHLLESEAAAPLWEDFDADLRYLDAANGMGQTFLWFGPAGTVTPLHHDTANVLFTQVTGVKRFTLISPLETHCVYNDIAVYSQVDPRAVDPERFPRFAATRRFEVTVGPGDAVFIPVGWWHQVESLETSASISFTNFLFPNAIEWFHPSAAY